MWYCFQASIGLVLFVVRILRYMKDILLRHQFYPDSYIREILSEVNNIALVGASPRPERDSFKCMEALIARGYNVIPVNPNEQDNLILGRLCYASLKAIKKPIDMVDIFRSSEAAFGITKDAVHIGVQVIWMQLGIRNFAAAKLAEDSGLKVVMDRCPKIELEKNILD